MSQSDPLLLPTRSTTPLLSLLEKRRSTRTFSGTRVQMSHLAHVLRAGSGRRSDGGSVVPSAHSLYRLSVGVVAGDIENLSPGSYTYAPEADELICQRLGDHRVDLVSATLVDQDWSAAAAAILVITAEIGAMNDHFADQPPLGRRGERYAWMEAGHISQNVYLAAAELDLGVVLIGGVHDEELSKAAAALFPSMAADSEALGFLALGHKACPVGGRPDVDG